MQLKSFTGKEIEIKIDIDGLKAYLTLNPTNNFILDISKVMHELWNKGVNFGIRDKSIQTAIDTKFFGESFVVAEGIPPIDGQDATIEYKFKEKKGVNLTENLDGRINFRETGKIELVRKGDFLAIKTPATLGIEGKTVTGKPIKAKNGQDVKILTSPTTRLSDDELTLIATVDGYVFWKDNTINIATVYEVKGDVDMHVGNIYFIGNVKIKGNVKEGFIVSTEGDIDIGEGVENATLKSLKGNITIARGIIGKRCSVYTNGNVKCKFIENAKIEAKGNVLVTDSIVHSNIFCDGSVLVLEGKRGVIMGGKIVAGKEVNAKNIGSISEVVTEIEVGIKPAIRTELNDLEESIEAARKDLQDAQLRYNSLILQNKPQLAAETLTQRKEIAKYLKEITELIIQLKKEISANKDGRISVFEKIWPGVKLVIKTAVLLLKVDDKYVTFIERFNIIERNEYQKPKDDKKEVVKKQVSYWKRDADLTWQKK